MSDGRKAMEDWKAETLAAYDRYPELFAERFAKHFRERVIVEANFFLYNLPGRRILDLGSGPGAHAEFFKGHGFSVLCTDLSPAMVGLCRQRGLRAEVADMEELEFNLGSFDGIWAYASLLHLPKARIPAMIAKLRKWLKTDGILSMAFKQGSDERLEDHERFPGAKRWFSYVTPEEVMGWCKDGFSPLRCTSQRVSERSTFISFAFARNG